MDEIENCVLCKKRLDVGGPAKVTVGEKGAAGINKASEQRSVSIHTVSGQRVHTICHCDYIKPSAIIQAQKQKNEGAKPSTSHTLRHSAEVTLIIVVTVFFCGKEIKRDKLKKRDLELSEALALKAKASILEVCNQRKDAWSDLVQARLLHVHDLPSAGALYHQTCSSNFRTGKQAPKAYMTEEIVYKKVKLGRPLDKVKTIAFHKTV